MSDSRISPRWDFFLAHASPDAPTAIELYEALRPHASVFLDRRTLTPGDPWSVLLPEALEQSRVILVLVSANTRRAWYQDSEVRVALGLIRNHPGQYRVIPLLLDAAAPVRRSELPYGLEQLVPLSWAECGSLDRVVDRLLGVLRDDGGRGQSGADPAGACDPPLADDVTAFLGETEWGPTRPVLLTSWADFAREFGRPLDTDRTYLPLSVRGFFENGGERAYVVRVIGRGAARAVARIPTLDPEQHLAVAARSVGGWANGLSIRVRPGSRVGVRVSVELAPGDGPTPRADGRPGGGRAAAEDYDNLLVGPTGPNPLLDVINRRSAWVTVGWAHSCRGGAEPAAGDWALAGGADGVISAGDYLGDPAAAAEDQTGLASLDPLDDVAIVCVPDAAHPRLAAAEREALIRSVVSGCEWQGRFAILAAGSGRGGDELPAAPADSPAGAAYYPWVTVPDCGSGAPVRVPPVGHIAGAYARHDRDRGVHVSPLGVELNGLAAGRVLEFPADAPEIDALARRGVNALCAESADPGRAILATAVTMAVDESMRRIGARRFFAFVQRRLTSGTAWARFVPGEATWARVREEVGAFLTRLWRAGILVGRTPDEAFFVRCDRTTMTEDDIANGRLVWQIGAALAEEDLRLPGSAIQSGPGPR